MENENGRLAVRLDNFDLRLLRIFITIVESGGFSAAQAKLGMSQSAISCKMHDLETRLGMCLCLRGRSGFKLTVEGQQVYEETLRLLSQLGQYENKLGLIREQIFGHVRIGVVDTIAMNPACRLPVSLREFTRKYPEVSVTLDVMESNEIEVLLLQGKLSIGLCSSDYEMPGLEYIPLFSERQRLYAAASHPVFQLDPPVSRKKDLLPFAIAGRGKPGVTPLDEADGFCSRAVSAHMEGTALLLLSGEQIGYLPEHYAVPWVAAGVLRVLDLPALDYFPAFSLCLPRYGQSSQATQRMLVELLAPYPQAAGKVVREHWPEAVI
ncbi:LysR family transcriptional regulator [Craterilacuibacter sinensis]|uniref:LysR family transcriptional regulator n=1 Tax=Craterilacuibacter sinensis TaxID=2686017 RepID=A0A845BJ00_9NEIS|nr:LysR family transcriptional regulator [Craterilacuibacter sinensis]MXR36169.1 LysR family transcriptional regulator [Craterilacuibacter sinensis]RQW25489.1 LysR family transcriptional regulator [Rhodobacteraceae bacterium CH30]